VIAKVREHVGPVASFKDVVIVPRLPKTRSGKIARNTLAAIAAGQPYKVVIPLPGGLFRRPLVVNTPTVDLVLFLIT